MIRILGLFLSRVPWLCLMGWASVVGSTELRAQFSPYLPPAGRSEVTVSHTYVTFDAFWAGSVRTWHSGDAGRFGKGPVEQPS